MQIEGGKLGFKTDSSRGKRRRQNIYHRMQKVTGNLQEDIKPVFTLLHRSLYGSRHQTKTSDLIPKVFNTN